MVIGNGKVVSIHYTLRDDAGAVLDSSIGGEPLAYLHGNGNIIKGLEDALEGRAEGECLSVEVAPAEAYGERREELVQQVPRSAFGESVELEPGMRFEARGPQGEQVVVVTAVDGDQVTVDGNHPLAGHTLAFEIDVSGVREATEQEIAHGHVHAGDAGDDGHD